MTGPCTHCGRAAQRLGYAMLPLLLAWAACASHPPRKIPIQCDALSCWDVIGRQLGELRLRQPSAAELEIDAELKNREEHQPQEDP